MKKQTEDILIAFALHEGLHYPDVKRIFKSQSKKNRNIQLKDMQKTIELNPPKGKHYPQNPKLRTNDIERSILESARTVENKKDEV